jgi:hypothetical protein
MPVAFAHAVALALKKFAIRAGLAFFALGYIFDIHFLYLLLILLKF